MTTIDLHINGLRQTLRADPSTPLAYVLRNQAGLGSVKIGCALEQCGACAVLVDGEARPSCVAPASQFVGCAIVTAEGLTEGGAPGAVQQAFIDAAATQCGYCTPGLVIAIEALRRRGAPGDAASVRAALQGHLCRCGTQAAVLRAAARVLGGDPR